MAKRSRKALTVYDQLKEKDPSFVEEVYTLSTDALKEKVVSLNKYSFELQEAKKADTDLQHKESEAREARKSYTEPLALNRLKRKLLVQILGERGQTVTIDEK